MLGSGKLSTKHTFRVLICRLVRLLTNSMIYVCGAVVLRNSVTLKLLVFFYRGKKNALCWGHACPSAYDLVSAPKPLVSIRYERLLIKVFEHFRFATISIHNKVCLHNELFYIPHKPFRRYFDVNTSLKSVRGSKAHRQKLARHEKC
jgi:hypothetical protein